MLHRLFPGFAAVIPFTLTGCGVLSMPMLERLDENNQAYVDRVWESAVAPRDRLARQSLLDLVVLGRYHERGVDRASYRAEKAVDKGTVVMEVSYDRAKPEDDRFEVTLLDERAKVVRKERYSREDVEEACHAMLSPLPEEEIDDAGNPVAEPPDVAARRQDRRLRMMPIEVILGEASEGDRGRHLH